MSQDLEVVQQKHEQMITVNGRDSEKHRTGA